MLAAVQAVVLVVRDDDDGAVTDGGRAASRTELDAAACGLGSTTRSDVRFGRRATDWELKGVPVRIEVGPRDLAEGQAIAGPPRRPASKEPVPLAASPAPWPTAARARSRPTMLAEATADARRRTVEVATSRRRCEAAAARLRPDPVVAAGRREGEAALGGDAVTVRCLQTPDGERARGRRRRRRDRPRRPLVLTAAVLIAGSSPSAQSWRRAGTAPAIRSEGSAYTGAGSGFPERRGRLPTPFVWPA